MAYVRKKYNLIIGEQTAEEIKITIGSALPLAEELEMEVRGRDQVAGLPKTIMLTSGEITEAMAEPLAADHRRHSPDAGEDPARAGRRHHRPGHGAERRRRAAAQRRPPGHEGDRRARVRGRAADGVRGAGCGPGAGKLRRHAAQPAHRRRRQLLGWAEMGHSLKDLPDCCDLLH